MGEEGETTRDPETKRLAETIETRRSQRSHRVGRGGPDQSWAFLAWDSDSQDRVARQQEGAPGPWTSRGEAAPRSAPPPGGLCRVSRLPAPQLPDPGQALPRCPSAPPSQPRALPLGLGHRAGPGVPEPTMSGCPSRGGRGGDQGLSASLRGPHFAPQGIFVKSLLARKEGTPASLVEPRRGLRSPKGPGTGEGRGGSAPTPILQVEPPRWLGRAGLSNLLRVEPLGLSPLLGSSLRSLCLSLSGLLTTPTPGSPASSGLLTAPLLLLLPLFLPFLRPLCLLGLPASWPGARPATTSAATAAAVPAPSPPPRNRLNPTPAGPQSCVSSEGGAVEGREKRGGVCRGARDSLTCRHLLPLAYGESKNLPTRGSAGCPPPHKLLLSSCHIFTGVHSNSMRKVPLFFPVFILKRGL